MKTYRPSSQMAWESSPIYHALTYCKPETITKESILEDFMEFIRDESEYDCSPEELARIQALINEFMAYDIDKVKAGELEMLEKWNKAINVE